jgi:hypothetical protein
VTQKKRKAKPASRPKTAKPARGWQTMIEKALETKRSPKPWADDVSFRAPRKGTSTD